MKLSCFLLSAILTAAPEQARIRGRVEDSAMEHLPNAVVRLIPKDSTSTKYRLAGDSAGMFASSDIAPGMYTLGISLRGFRERFVRDVALAAGQIKDVGPIVLDFAGCDAPGVSCDSGKPSSILASGYFSLHRSCGADLDLDRDSVACPQAGKTMPTRLRNRIDLWFSDNKDGVYLTPGNGASISPPNPDKGCEEAKYDKTPVRIDGLGAGSDLCVRTSDGRSSHVFITSEVTADPILKLWHVTR
jgi:Carboxypeptidase regulatory-like domain